MTREQLEQKFMDWAERCGIYADASRLDNAVVILSYDAGETESTLSGVSINAMAVHAGSIHVFLFAERTTWKKTEHGDAGEIVSAQYRLLVRF